MFQSIGFRSCSQNKSDEINVSEMLGKLHTTCLIAIMTIFSSKEVELARHQH